MGKIDTQRPTTSFAKAGERERGLPATDQGREPGDDEELPSLADEEIAAKTVGARPLGDVTDQHDASGDEETDDGLNATDEAVRHAAEDLPSSEEDDGLDSVPVFDRRELPPRI